MCGRGRVLERQAVECAAKGRGPRGKAWLREHAPPASLGISRGQWRLSVSCIAPCLPCLLPFPLPLPGCFALTALTSVCCNAMCCQLLPGTALASIILLRAPLRPPLPPSLCPQVSDAIAAYLRAADTSKYSEVIAKAGEVGGAGMGGEGGGGVRWSGLQRKERQKEDKKWTS